MVATGAVSKLLFHHLRKSVVTTAEIRALRQRLAAVPPTLSARLGARDLGDALVVFLLVVLSTFPLVIPFMLFDETARALLWSRLVAVATLFLAGAMLARYSGGNPWLSGLTMAALGALLMAAIMALGG
jgi:VIT1/CCC1 family predicted Fe2+/Mn2+ transporter